MCRLTSASGIACAAVPILGIAPPALYWHLAVRRWPALSPAAEAASRLVFVAFGVVSFGFIRQTGLLLVHGGAHLEKRVRWNWHRFALAYRQMVAISIGVAWITVAYRNREPKIALRRR